MKQFLLITIMVASTVASAGTAIRCTARGKALSKAGDRPIPVDASLSFNEVVSTEGTRTLSDLKGRVVVDPDETVYGKYVGNFNVRSVVENLRYEPDRYVGFSQFPNVDATDTRESGEQGMWGNLLLEQNTRKATFAAHYIFKAGDHMGGTIHFSCEKR